MSQTRISTRNYIKNNFNPGLLGKVTSVPVARVPKLFIDSEQMHKKLQHEVKGTIKGEEAEQQLYRLFTEHSGCNMTSSQHKSL